MDKKALESFEKNAGNVITDAAKQLELGTVRAAEKFLLDEISKGMPQHEFDRLLKSTLQTIETNYRRYYKLSVNGLKPKE